MSQPAAAAAEYLVVGASGQIGGELVRQLRAQGRRAVGTHLFHPDSDRRLDISDAAQVRQLFLEIKPRVVFVPGGMTNVDECERRGEAADEINARGPRHLAQAARDVGARVVLFSTDYVCDGRSGPYAETTEPNPINTYGRSKLDGEQSVASSGATHCIVRTCVAFSYLPHHSNFFMQVFDKLKTGNKFTPFTDQFITPTYAPSLARAAIEAADRGLSGILHIAGPECVSRLEFCRRLAQRFGFRQDLLEPVETASVALAARRPLRAGLKCDRARSALKTPLLGIDAAFEDIARKVSESPA